MPKISIIVPIYKVEPYLHRCVDSILAQTFADFECILVDDGSPDRCGEICDEYAAKDKRIKVIHKPNGGLSDARNAGIDIARGEYIGFVDSDDWIHPQMYEILYNGIIENDVKLSVCAFEEVDEVKEFDTIKNISFTRHYGMDFLVEDNVTAVVAWNKLYHSSLFDNIRYPVGRIHEDEFTTYKLLYRAGNIVSCEYNLYKYYINPVGITRSEYSVKRLDALDALEERNIFFQKNNLPQYNEWSVDQLLYAYRKHYTLTDGKTTFRKTHNRIKQKMRLLLISSRIKYRFYIKNHADYYEMAFPRFMKWYWLYDIIKEKKKKEGIPVILKGVFKRIFSL